MTQILVEIFDNCSQYARYCEMMKEEEEDLFSSPVSIDKKFDKCGLFNN